MMKKALLGLALLLSASNLFSYTYTFYNATNAPVWIDPYFSRLSLGDEQMFQGVAPVQKYNATQTAWKNATRLQGPVQLLAHKRYKFSVDAWWAKGLCFDRVFVGPTKDDIQKVQVKIAETAQFQRIMNAAKTFTQETSQTAGDIAEIVDKNQPNKKQVAGTTRSSGKAAEQIVSSLTGLLRLSQCGNLDFMIATDKDGSLTAIIQK